MTARPLPPAPRPVPAHRDAWWSTARLARTRRAGARLGTVLSVLAASLAVGTVVADTASAATTAQCTNSLYIINSNDGLVHPISFTGEVGAAVYDGDPNSENGANQLGIGRGGAYAINATSSHIYEYDFDTGQRVQTNKASGSGVAGAVSPVGAGYYYYGSYSVESGTTYLNLYAYDVAANQSRGQVARVAVPNVPGTDNNGDMAFASDGTLYYLNSSGGTAHLYRFDQTVPTAGPVTTFPASDSTQITTNAGSGNANGIAFGSDGFLYLGRSTSLTQVNPITGATVGSPLAFSGVSASSVDLGSCAGPNTIETGVTLPDNRLTPGDQFTITITGPEYGSGGGQLTPPTGTTTGTDGGPQTQPAETAGPAMVLPNQTYTTTVTGAGGTDIDDYNVGYVCRNADGTITRQGTGTSVAITPGAGTGVTEDCSFTAQNPVDLQKSVSPTTFDRAGQTLTYTFLAANDDTAALADFQISDPMTGLSPITCTPVQQGQALAAGETTTCTATYTTTQADVRSGNARNTSPKTNTATMTTAPRPGSSLTLASATSTVSATSTATGVRAINDSAGTQFRTPVVLLGSTNDTVGSSPVLHGSVRLTSASATAGGTLLSTAQGVWEVLVDGRIRFTPASAFSGSTSNVQYEVTDTDGFTDTATMRVDVRSGPSANIDAPSTGQNLDRTFRPYANDVPGRRADDTDGAFQPATLLFPAIAQQPAVPTNGGRTLAVPGEGTYTIDASTGQVTFDPDPAFVGTASSVTYAVEDQAGNSVTSTISMTVRPITPTATDDTASTQYATAVALAGATNDTPGSDGGTTVAIVPGNTVFAPSGQPAGATVASGGKSLTVPGQGDWVLQADGSVGFTPAAGYSGTTALVTYRVEDANGTTDTGTLQVVVRPGPIAANDSGQTPFDTDVTLTVTGNDTPGLRANGSAGAFTTSSVRFAASGQPSGATLDGTGRVLTVPGQGVWTIDAGTGRITLNPAAGFAGTTSGVRYEVTDQASNVASALASVVVRPAPTADADSSTTAQNVTVTDIDVLDGDVPGPNADGTAGSFVPGSAVFELTGLPAGSALGSGGRTLTVPGEGVYSFEGDDEVSFDPVASFAGAATPVQYRVTDSHGNLAAATLTVTVAAIDPTANDDTATTRFGDAVRLAGVTDDAGGAASAPLVASLTVFPSAGQPTGAIVSNGGRTLSMPGEGVWTVDPVVGDVEFAPAAGFAGVASPVVYRIEDANGTQDTATLAVTVRPGPQPAADSASTGQNETVVLDPLANDQMALDVDGTTRATADRPTLVLLATGSLPAGSTLSADRRTLVVPGQGTWSVLTGGRVEFDPLPRFTGVAATVTYEALDSFGNTLTSTMTVSVDARTPQAVADVAATAFATPVVVDVLANDLAATGAALDPASLRLIDPASGQPVTEVVVAGEGTWTVVDGRLRFTPQAGFTGTATEVRYVVADVNGTTAQAGATVAVGAPDEGGTEPTRGSTAKGDPVTLSVLDNIVPTEGEEIVVESLCLVPGTVKVKGGSGRAALRCVKEYTEPGVGTWTVDPGGTLTFTPVEGFVGTASIEFQVRDTAAVVYSETATVEVKGRAKQTRGDGDEDDGRDGRTDVEGVDEQREPLPDAGGVPLGLLIAGLLSSGGGVVLIRRSRTTTAPRHRA